MPGRQCLIMMYNADVSMRLDRLLTTLALGSRTQVRHIIKSGRISVNGKQITSPEIHTKIGDLIMLDGKTLDARTVRHVMLYKPRGVLTAAKDRYQKTVLDLLPPLYASCGCMPAGRLDKDTEGLLLLTTDGELCHRLLSPERHVWKHYIAEVDGPLTEEHIELFQNGIILSDFTAKPARMEIIHSGADGSAASVWIREGKYHQVRRMFEAAGRTVTSLKRLSFGPLLLDESLSPGMYRELTDSELSALQRSACREESE